MLPFLLCQFRQSLPLRTRSSEAHLHTKSGPHPKVESTVNDRIQAPRLHPHLAHLPRTQTRVQAVVVVTIRKEKDTDTISPMVRISMLTRVLHLECPPLAQFQVQPTPGLAFKSLLILKSCTIILIIDIIVIIVTPPHGHLAKHCVEKPASPVNKNAWSARSTALKGTSRSSPSGTSGSR